jgi:hypothetical protein
MYCPLGSCRARCQPSRRGSRLYSRSVLTLWSEHPERSGSRRTLRNMLREGVAREQVTATEHELRLWCALGPGSRRPHSRARRDAHGLGPDVQVCHADTPRHLLRR